MDGCDGIECCCHAFGLWLLLLLCCLEEHMLFCATQWDESCACVCVCVSAACPTVVAVDRTVGGVAGIVRAATATAVPPPISARPTSDAKACLDDEPGCCNRHGTVQDSSRSSTVGHNDTVCYILMSNEMK
jgi:hypothetical protein